MAKTTRTISANHFVAESLDELANSLPPGGSEQAKILHCAADIYRTFPTSKLVRIHEEAEDFSQSAARAVTEATER